MDYPRYIRDYYMKLNPNTGILYTASEIAAITHLDLNTILVWETWSHNFAKRFYDTHKVAAVDDNYITQWKLENPEPTNVIHTPWGDKTIKRNIGSVPEEEFWQKLTEVIMNTIKNTAPLILVILTIILSCMIGYAQTPTITFAWDVHPEAASVTGYKLYQGKVAGAENMVTPVATYVGGSLTTGTLPKPGLGNYCWVLTAYVTDTLVPPNTYESDKSNEVCLVIRPSAPRMKSATQALMLIPIEGGKGLLAMVQVDGDGNVIPSDTDIKIKFDW